MKENTTFLSRRILYGVILVTLALIAVGSFVDFPLSYALYDASNPFAMFFAAYGAFPAPPWLRGGWHIVCVRAQPR